MAAAVAIANRRAELAQDRYLRNREHVRGAIDTTVVAMSKAQEAVGKFKAAVTGVEATRDRERQVAAGAGADKEQQELKKLAELEAALQEKLEQWRDTGQPVVEALAASEVRLSVRLVPGDPVLAEHGKAREAIYAQWEALSTGVMNSRGQKERDADTALNKFRLDRHKDFLKACHVWFMDEAEPKSSWRRIWLPVGNSERQSP